MNSAMLVFGWMGDRLFNTVPSWHQLSPPTAAIVYNLHQQQTTYLVLDYYGGVCVSAE